MIRATEQDYSAWKLALEVEFNAIPCIDVAAWAGKIECGSNTRSTALAKTWAVAVRLYGILALPQSAITSWWDKSTEAPIAYPRLPGLSVYESLRVGHREKLVRLLRETWGPVQEKSCLCWPLIVAGVAVAGGTKEDRYFVMDCLLELWSVPSTVSSFIHTIEKIRLFWSLGKTGWDDCFYEPTESMP